MPPPPPPPPSASSESILSTLDLDFLNFAGMSVLALMIVYFIYSCYERKYSHRNRDIEGGSRRRTVAPAPAAASSGGNQRAVAARGRTPSTAVMCTSLFQYGEGGIEGKNGDCSICLDEFTEGEVCRMLPKCKHIFHRYCIDQWLPTKRHCPLCRSSVRVRMIFSYHSRD